MADELTTIDVKGIGPLQFPSSMSKEEMETAIQSHPKYKSVVESQNKPWYQRWIESVGRIQAEQADSDRASSGVTGQFVRGMPLVGEAVNRILPPSEDEKSIIEGSPGVAHGAQIAGGLVGGLSAAGAVAKGVGALRNAGSISNLVMQALGNAGVGGADTAARGGGASDVALSGALNAAPSALGLGIKGIGALGNKLLSPNVTTQKILESMRMEPEEAAAKAIRARAESNFAASIAKEPFSGIKNPARPDLGKATPPSATRPNLASSAEADLAADKLAKIEEGIAHGNFPTPPQSPGEVDSMYLRIMGKKGGRESMRGAAEYGIVNPDDVAASVARAKAQDMYMKADPSAAMKGMYSLGGAAAGGTLGHMFAGSPVESAVLGLLGGDAAAYLVHGARLARQHPKQAKQLFEKMGVVKPATLQARAQAPFSTADILHRLSMQPDDSEQQ